MNEKKYPAGLFWVGFVTNVIFHFFWLFLPAVVLIIAGIFLRVCLYIGLAVLALDVILSFIQQLRIRAAFMSDSDNPDFREFQRALSKDGKWIDNVQEFVDERMTKSSDNRD
ncbi:MAG: hypothetical protein ACI4QY_03790 [Oscillospiraceae bacterium]